MADEGFAPDEWDPPALSRHMPFPPPVIVDLDVFDSAPLFVFLLEATLYYRAWHASVPWWYWFAVVGIALVWTLNAAIRPQGRRLFAWIPILARYFWLWLRAPIMMRPIPYRWARRMHRGGVKGFWTILLPREEGRRRLANIDIGEDGVINTSAGDQENRVVRWFKWLLAISLGKEPLVQLVWVSATGSLDLLDPEAREGVWAARQELLARPEHRMSLYLRVRPFPVRDILVASGAIGTLIDSGQPGGEDLSSWAETLVDRRLLLAIPGATRRVLSSRLLELLGVEEQPGKLGRAGLYGRKLNEDELEALGTDAWGTLFRPALAISPNRIEVETGESDPKPIGDVPEQPEGGNPGVRRHCTYTITGLPDIINVGWMEPLTGRRIHCDVAMHIEPVRDSWAEAVLGLKAVWWKGLSMGADKYALAATQARRTINMIRRRRSTALKVGMYATVSDTQTPIAELALKEMVGRNNFKVASFETVAARMSTEPTGRDPLNQRWWTDSQTIAAAWPGTGGIWVDGCVLIGDCPRSNEPIGWNPWWLGDETSLGIILGRTGSGKTNLEQKIAGEIIEPHPEHWLAARQVPVIVVYLKAYDEWEAYCRHYRGHHFHLGVDGDGHSWREALGHADGHGGWVEGTAPMNSRVVAFNIIGLPDMEQVAFMSELEHWVEAHQKPHRFKYPLMYIIGEAWAWAQDPVMAKHLQKYALTVRTLGIGLLVDTQRPKHLLNSVASDLLESASMWCLMRLRTSERKVLQELVDIGDEGMKILAQIAQPNTLSGGVQVMKGRGIIEAHGIRSTVQVKRFGYEIGLLDQTNPRLRDETWFENADLDIEDDDDDLELVGAFSKNGVTHATVGD